MNSESYLVMLSALLGAFGIRLRKWLKQRRKVSVSYQSGNGTSLTVETTLSSNQDQEKED